MNKRNNYSAEFKTKVVLEVLQEDDMGPLNIAGPCGEFIDGHFIFEKSGSGDLSSCLVYHNPNGVRPALWLRDL
jgi:hypothetical protein